jgi:Tfp pilus assembly protein PilF
MMKARMALPVGLLAAGFAATMAVAAVPRDDAIKPLSARMLDSGRAALAAGNANAAIDAFEAALAADPRNVQAFTGLAQSYEKLGLPGKAVKFYREALLINPSDINALEGQGKALIARGATARAQVNLARIKALCKPECAQAKRLEQAIAAAATAKTASAAPVTADTAKD